MCGKKYCRNQTQQAACSVAPPPRPAPAAASVGAGGGELCAREPTWTWTWTMYQTDCASRGHSVPRVCVEQIVRGPGEAQAPGHEEDDDEHPSEDLAKHGGGWLPGSGWAGQEQERIQKRRLEICRASRQLMLYTREGVEATPLNSSCTCLRCWCHELTGHWYQSAGDNARHIVRCMFVCLCQRLCNQLIATVDFAA